MGNSLRCCLACVIPCGALDIVRIVHLNGHVEEITNPVTAGEVLKNNPNHILSKPFSEGAVHKILILSPETELKRGSIYFLIPKSSVPEKKINKNHTKKSSKKNKKFCDDLGDPPAKSDALLTEFTPEKKTSLRHRRTSMGRSGIWKPQLESISEDQ